MICQLSLLASQILLSFLSERLGTSFQTALSGGGGRFPLGPSAGDLTRAAVILRDLRMRGLEGRTAIDPVTGSLVVGTTGQDIPTLAAEAAQRQLSQQAIADILREDPLFFVRLLPPGDPRRVASGLDGNGSRPATTTIVSSSLLQQRPRRTTAIVPGTPPLRRRPGLFARRLSVGPVAVR